MISIVIPLYNKGKLVERTLDSIRRQSFTDYEVVIIDDGSTDHSPEIAREYIARVGIPKARIVSQPNAGVGAARNHGIRVADGEFVAFLDADDEWKERHLQDLDFLARNFPHCKVFATNYEYQTKDGNISHNRFNGLNFEGDYGIIDNYFEIASTSQPPLWTSAVMVRREAIMEIGGFPEGIKSGEDLLTWARLALHCDIAFCKNPSAVYQLGNSNPRPPEKNDLVGDQLELIYIGNREVKGLRKYLALWFNMRMSRCLASHRYGAAMQALAKSVKYRPTIRIAKPLLKYTLMGLKK